MTVQGPPSTALATRKRLHVTEFTMLITVMPQPRKPHTIKTLKAFVTTISGKSTQPLPPICFGTLNSASSQKKFEV